MTFEELAAEPDATLDDLALAMAAEFGPVDADWAYERLDALGEEVAAADGDLAGVLGDRHGFAGDREHYDDPPNSMLDRVLRSKRGLPILLSAVYTEVGRRAGVQVDGIGLPGHFVVAVEGRLVDPFAGGAAITAEVPAELLAPWPPHDIAMRMLNNLVPAYQRRGDLGRALRAAELRLLLPTDTDARATLRAELTAMRALLN